MEPEELTVPIIEEAISLPSCDWIGRCHAISTLILDQGLVEGRAPYGHWRGHVHPASIFADTQRRAGFSNHGWILLPDDRILDATRWVFEVSAPYIWLGTDPSRSEYDEGGQWFRADHALAAPGYRHDRPAKALLWELHQGSYPDTWDFVAKQLGTTGDATIEQCAWLASQSIDWLADHAHPIYSALVALGLSALIPHDNALQVLGEDVVDLLEQEAYA